jgi:hypothetical protein
VTTSERGPAKGPAKGSSDQAPAAAAQASPAARPQLPRIDVAFPKVELDRVGLDKIERQMETPGMAKPPAPSLSLGPAVAVGGAGTLLAVGAVFLGGPLSLVAGAVGVVASIVGFAKASRSIRSDSDPAKSAAR